MTEISHAREISRDVFSATLGSVFCCYTGQPMDTIKVRMQTKPTLYTGIGKTLSLTVSNEGLVALWKGGETKLLSLLKERTNNKPKLIDQI